LVDRSFLLKWGKTTVSGRKLPERRENHPKSPNEEGSKQKPCGTESEEWIHYQDEQIKKTQKMTAKKFGGTKNHLAAGAMDVVKVVENGV